MLFEASHLQQSFEESGVSFPHKIVPLIVSVQMYDYLYWQSTVPINFISLPLQSKARDTEAASFEVPDAQAMFAARHDLRWCH